MWVSGVNLANLADGCSAGICIHLLPMWATVVGVASFESLSAPSEVSSLWQAQRRALSRWSRTCWRRWGRWLMSFPLWASAGGRGDPHTPSLWKTCTGWGRTHKTDTNKTILIRIEVVILSWLLLDPSTLQVIETLLFSTFVSWKAFFPLVREDSNCTYTFITGDVSSEGEGLKSCLVLLDTEIHHKGSGRAMLNCWYCFLAF